MKSLKHTFVLITLFVCFGNLYTQSWLPLGPGIGCFNEEGVFDLNLNNNGDKLFIAGIIGSDGNCTEMRATLTWDGNFFEQTASHNGVSSASILFEYNNEIYSSGPLIQQTGATLDFNIVSEMEAWDTVPSGIDGGIYDYQIKDGLIYLSGAFQTCGGQPCSIVAKYDGEQVESMYNNPTTSGFAFALEYYQDTLYVAGNYTAGGKLSSQGYRKCCKLVDGQLELLSQGFFGGGTCNALEVFDDKLFVGGYSRPIGFDESHTLYYYENGQFFTLPEEPNYQINALKAYNGGLYVAGDFDMIGNTPCYGAARWDGETWTCLCNEPMFLQNGNLCVLECINDIEIWNDTLYVGGRFNSIGSNVLKRIAKLDMALSEEFPTMISEPDFVIQQLSISPNPATNDITISTNQHFSPSTQIQFFDLSGRLILTEQIQSGSNKITIDVGNLSSGIYTCVVSDKNERNKPLRWVKE